MAAARSGEEVEGDVGEEQDWVAEKKEDGGVIGEVEPVPGLPM